MNKLPVTAVFLSLTSAVAFAYDSDPGYGPRADLSQQAGIRKARSANAIYFKPTMRYYGKGYTVTYRYVQWNDKMNRTGQTTFEGEQHYLPLASLQSVIGSSPRMTYYYGGKSNLQSPYEPADTRAGRSIVTAPATKEPPPIAESIRK
jgi:hypothetical protein